jgi:hypothetical protein
MVSSAQNVVAWSLLNALPFQAQEAPKPRMVCWTEVESTVQEAAFKVCDGKIQNKKKNQII